MFTPVTFNPASEEFFKCMYDTQSQLLKAVLSENTVSNLVFKLREKHPKVRNSDSCEILCGSKVCSPIQSWLFVILSHIFDLLV